MHIDTLKVAEHRGCMIYIRHFYNTFEYIAVIRGQVYTSHINVTPQFFRTFMRERFTKDQLTAITKQLMVMAETTIDTVLDSK